jgi:hypothetical protein
MYELQHIDEYIIKIKTMFNLTKEQTMERARDGALMEITVMAGAHSLVYFQFEPCFLRL